MAYTTIDKPTDYFNTVLYTGNGSTNAITGVGHAPDWVWIKSRGTTGEDHYFFDQLRGVTKYIHSNTTAGTGTNSATLTTFGSDGFTVGANNSVNKSSDPLVSWNWKANGSGAANTAGSINTTKTSAETTSGCSIITYTGNGSSGATIGHGMGIKPSMILVKETAGGNDWIVYTQALTANKILYLNTSGVANDNSVFFNDTEPTTSLITLGSIGATNGNGVAMVAYCFSNVQGFSKQGSYTGNGNADGTFAYTGFKPAWVMIKNTTSSAAWNITDAKRDTFNVAGKGLFANESSAESAIAGREIDFLSNGFKIRTSGGEKNTSGNIYIYMAFAESPFVSSTGIPATAR